MDSQFDDSTHGSSADTMYIGNDTIAFSFTGKHFYQKGDEDLLPGELVKLVDGKSYRVTDKADPTAIGIFWGITRKTDSMNTKLIEWKEIDVEYIEKDDQGNDIIQTKKKKTNEEIRLSDKQPATSADFAYAVASLGDSRDIHDTFPLDGAYVTINAGTIKSGDFLCSSAKAGYLEKQSDDVMHSYTVAQARQDIDVDTKTAYVYLLQ